MTNQILVVEDDQDLRECIVQFLTNERFVVHTAADGVQALSSVEKLEPNLVILDLGLPNLKGEMVCTEIKKNFPEIQIVILTGKDTTSDIVQGLSLGADDYMTKPFEMDELVARVKTRLRGSTAQDEKLSIDNLVIDQKSMEVRRGERLIPLTPQEYNLLEYLILNTGRVLTREMILSRLWKGNADVETRVVDVYIGYLRKKIENPGEKTLIHSVRGFGYKITS